MTAPSLEVTHTSALEIQSTVQDVRVASEWMAEFATLHRVPHAQVNRLDLCLNEALANIIAHGSEASLAQSVRIGVQVAQSHTDVEATVTVSDAGPEFDSANAPLQARAHTLAEVQPGGLGLLIIRRFSDALHYQRTDGRNELTFTVKWKMTLN